jgi:hypothetical protein
MKVVDIYWKVIHLLTGESDDLSLDKVHFFRRKLCGHLLKIGIPLFVVRTNGQLLDGN